MYPHWKKNPESEVEWFEGLTALARYLRLPEGCPWDREQTHQSLRRYLLEETHEALEAPKYRIETTKWPRVQGRCYRICDRRRDTENPFKLNSNINFEL